MFWFDVLDQPVSIHTYILNHIHSYKTRTLSTYFLLLSFYRRLQGCIVILYNSVLLLPIRLNYLSSTSSIHTHISHSCYSPVISHTDRTRKEKDKPKHSKDRDIYQDQSDKGLINNSKTKTKSRLGPGPTLLCLCLDRVKATIYAGVRHSPTQNPRDGRIETVPGLPVPPTAQHSAAQATDSTTTILKEDIPRITVLWSKP